MHDPSLRLMADMELIRRWLRHTKEDSAYGYRLILRPTDEVDQWAAILCDNERKLTGLTPKGPATMCELAHELASLIHTQLSSRRNRIKDEATKEQRALDQVVGNWPLGEKEKCEQ